MYRCPTFLLMAIPGRSVPDEDALSELATGQAVRNAVLYGDETN